VSGFTASHIAKSFDQSLRLIYPYRALTSFRRMTLMLKLFRSRIVLAAALLLVMPVASTPFANAAPPAAPAVPAGKIDINTATADQLKAFPGIGDAYSARIIAGRPYANKGQLVSKGVLPQATYNKIKDQIIATQPKK
jgi:competence protein ComEA